LRHLPQVVFGKMKRFELISVLFRVMLAAKAFASERLIYAVTHNTTAKFFSTAPEDIPTAEPGSGTSTKIGLQGAGLSHFPAFVQQTLHRVHAAGPIEVRGKQAYWAPANPWVRPLGACDPEELLSMEAGVENHVLSRSSGGVNDEVAGFWCGGSVGVQELLIEGQHRILFVKCSNMIVLTL
jgi:hypothetical protein